MPRTTVSETGNPNRTFGELLMTSDKTPLPERVAAYYSQLTAVAADLNAVSDALGKSISEIDDALRALNLGISVWVKIRGGDGDQDRGDASFWSEELGYAKISGKWGVGLRRSDGNYNEPDSEDVQAWLFNDAPRSLRIEAIEKIPELLEKLSKDGAKAAKKIQEKLADAQAVAGAITEAARGPKHGRTASVAIKFGEQK